MKSKLMPIVDRDIGVLTLVCIRCGRYWGKDDILPLTDEEPITERQQGYCPVCKEEGEEGRVFKIVDIRDEIGREKTKKFIQFCQGTATAEEG